MNINSIVRELEQFKNNYYGGRICAEFGYLNQLSQFDGGMHGDEIAGAGAALLAAAKSKGAVTREDCEAAEARLAPLSGWAKKYTVMPVGHAHIDMNWMWSYPETVEITLETFRTTLKLMDEIPEFTFAQSQASCYRIVEQFDPAMLAQIKARVAEGRWEVTASHWVEADKNMSSGESLSRHLLYTKNYMGKLFGLKPEQLEVDYEPDTFGHAANTPEILGQGGVKYYYHCRAHDGEDIYNWEALSGARVLVYRDPAWYGRAIDYEHFKCVPSFCDKNKADAMLLIYGMGDHGGGPTKRDICRLLDMRGWPLFPEIRFGTYHGFFRHIGQYSERFPVHSKERNFIFPGCYTTQTRIKAGNKQTENAMFESEAASALAAKIAGSAYDPAYFEEAWRGILFNQFHDILPGSGVIDTREYAGALYQNAYAAASAQRAMALRAIAQATCAAGAAGGNDAGVGASAGAVECAAQAGGIPGDGGIPGEGEMSEGAGVGYNVDARLSNYTERGFGRQRRYMLFNLTACDKCEAVEIVLWDYNYDLSALTVKDDKGNALPYDIISGRDMTFFSKGNYWGHTYTKLLIYAPVPAFGGALVVVDCDYDAKIDTSIGNDTRLDVPFEYILSNEKITAKINPADGSIESIADNASGKVIIKNARFENLIENQNNMSSWRVGRHTNDACAFKVLEIEHGVKGGVRAEVIVKGIYRNSKIEYALSLDRGDAFVKISATVDWLEVGTVATGIPQLRYVSDLCYSPNKYTYDIPAGTVQRDALDMDTPGLSYCCAVNGGGGSAMIVSGTKYGFRNFGGSMALTLIRSSYSPDPYPELCRHNIMFYIGITGCADPLHLKNVSSDKIHPCTVISIPPDMNAAAPGSMLKVEGAAVSCVKLAEDGSGDIIVRLYEAGGAPQAAKVCFGFGVKAAYACDALERKLEELAVSGGALKTELGAFKLKSIRVVC